MKDFIAKLKQWFADLFGKMEKGKLIRLVVLAALIIVIVVGAVIVLGRKEYATLYSGMSASDAGQMYTVLKERGVDVRTKGTGAVEVPAEMVDQLIIEMAAEGYPDTGLAYDIFEKASAFGTTDIEKQTYQIMQLQENLARALRRLAKIKDAVVIISPEKTSAYVVSEGLHPATASVVLELQSGVDMLSTTEIEMIRRLVSRAVPNLALENIEISDTMMNDYTGLESEAQLENFADHEALRSSTQERLERQVKNLLALVFGPTRVGVAVNVKLDFDRAISESEVFSPPVEGSEQGLEVSVKELSESVNGGTGAGGVVGQDPNGTAPSYPEVAGSSDQQYSKTSREANLEINSIKTQIERAQGQISDLSVAVMIDSSDETIEDYSAQVRSLVMQALGVDEDRISVERMRFLSAENEATSALDEYKALMDQAQSTSIIRTAIIALAIIVVMLLILLMIRTMFKKKQPETEAPQMDMAEAGQYVDLSAEDEYDEQGYSEDEEYYGEDGMPIGSEGKSLSREQIENFIERDAESAAQLLRNWLSDT